MAAGVGVGVGVGVEERRFRGEPALVLRAGELTATFLPGLGMTGVSLRDRGREFLALPGGLEGLRAGKTMGLPLLAPWANRLAGRRYRVGRIAVDLTGRPLETDENGLPIHGLLVGVPGWQVGRQSARGSAARVEACRDVDDPAFPFPHRIDIATTVDLGGRLTIATSVTATGRRGVPVAFGWHPYLRLPGVARRQWRLRLPKRKHLALDTRGIPTGEHDDEPAESAPIGRRTFDDLYALGGGRNRLLAFDAAPGDDGDGPAVELRCGTGYPYAQVWVPAGRPFAALEPMTAPTNALVTGTTPMVRPGETFTATFELRLRAAP
jgi:galactose mutarotase-like enzyme